jgi:hypothetical protein
MSFRRALVAVLLLVSGLLAGGAPVEAGSAAGAGDARLLVDPPPYANPLVGGKTVNPFMLVTTSGGAPTYYAYFSGLDFNGHVNVPAYTSTDLVHWTQLGNVLPDANVGSWADKTSGLKFSSPSVLFVNSNGTTQKYVMYYTGTNATTGEKCIGVATAGAPQGPFSSPGGPLICGAQDPSPIDLGGAGSLQQLVYEKNGTNAGIYNQVLPLDGLSLGTSPPAPHLLYTAQPSWWQNGALDRPAVTPTPSGGADLFFGGNTLNTAKTSTSVGHGVGWAPCSTFTVVVTACDKPSQLSPWLSETSSVLSPSGVQFFTVGGAKWLTYSALPAGSCPGGTCSGNPTMRVDKVCFSHGVPRTNAPSVGGSQSQVRPPSCSADIPGAPFSVSSVSDPGGANDVVSQPANVVFRDGAMSTPAGGRTLWIYSDTLVQGGCHALTNSASVGVPSASGPRPNWTEEHLDAGGCAEQFIPYTNDEKAYNDLHGCPVQNGPPCESGRIGLWVTGEMSQANGDAVVFFWKFKEYSVLDGQGHETRVGESQGIGAVHVSAASIASVHPVGDRSPAVSPYACNPTCLLSATATTQSNGSGALYGAPLVDADHGFLYLTGPGKTILPYHGGQIARASLASWENPASWSFWFDDGTSDGDFSPTSTDADPVPNLREANSIFYSPYLDKYVAITGGGPFEPSTFFMQTAPEVTGPWTVADTPTTQPVFVGVPCDAAGQYRAYASMLHPELTEDNGRTLAVTYARPRGPAGSGCPGQIRYVRVKLQ